MTRTFWICVHLILVGILHDGDAITYGIAAEEDQFKYMAFIDNLRFKCGGAVLDKYHILTAAHCVDGFTASKILVVAGTVSLVEPWRVIRKVKKIYVHPNYRDRSSRSSLGYYVQSCIRSIEPYLRNTRSKNDIAVLRLAESLPLGGNITSVDLPWSDSLPYAIALNYAGWRKTEYENYYQLRYTYLEILSREESRRWYISYRENEFYTKSITGRSHANIGDNGNPAVIGNFVYGITADAVLCQGGWIRFTKVFNHLSSIWNATSDVDDFDNC